MRVRFAAALVLLAAVFIGGAASPQPARAEAVGYFGGVLELTAVFFSEGDRTFGAGEVVTMSGAVPFVPKAFCPSTLRYGVGRGEFEIGFVDPFPTADLYVIKDDGSALILGASVLSPFVKLDDASGGVNRVIALSSGAFVEEPVGIVKPAGNLDAGRYDVVMDQCLDGYYDPLVDIVLGDGASFAFEVVIPGDLPPINLAPLKREAKWYSTGLGGAEFGQGDATIKIPGLCKRMEKWAEKAALAGSAGILGNIAIKKCADLEKRWDGIAQDPPDANFTAFAELGPIDYDFRAVETPLERAIQRLANTMGEQVAISQAFLTTLERFQGAQAAGNDEYMVLQLEELDKLVNLLMGNGGNLLRFYAALEGLDLALTADPGGAPAEASALRETIPELRRGIGGLLNKLGIREDRKKVGGRDVIEPVGLQAWISVYLGRNPFAADLGLFGIPHVRARKGLPPLAFRHPTAATTGPYTAPPGRSIGFDGTRSNDPNGDSLALAWDLDADGQFDDGTGTAVGRAFGEAGTRLVGLKATDPAGNTDVRYTLLKIGDLTTQDIIVATRSDIRRVSPAGEMTTIVTNSVGWFAPRALEVDANGDILLADPAHLWRFSSSGELIRKLTLADLSRIAGVQIYSLSDMTLDGRGDMLVVAKFVRDGRVASDALLLRVTADAASASIVLEPINPPYGGLGQDFGDVEHGIALDPDGNIVVDAAKLRNGSGTGVGAIVVDPDTGQVQQVLPSSLSVLPDGRQDQPLLTVGGSVVGQLSGGPGNITVDPQGNYIMGSGHTGVLPLRVWRVPMPAQISVLGENCCAVVRGIEVFPLHFRSADLNIQPNDLEIDRGGDTIVAGLWVFVENGIWRISPAGEAFKLVNFEAGFLTEPKALAVVPDVREVTAKDVAALEPLPSVQLTSLSVNQQTCPGAAQVGATLKNTGTGPLTTASRVHFFDGDPLAGGEPIGSAVAPGPIAPGGSADVSISWPSPSAGVHQVFAMALGANMPFKAFMVCVAAPAVTPADAAAPTTSASPSPHANGAGWNKGDVTVTLAATDNEGGSGVKEIVYSANGAGAITATTVSGGSATVLLAAEGVTTLTYFARDNAGNAEQAKTLTLRIDKTAPQISPTRTPQANANGWNNSDVTVSFACEDALSGISSCNGPVTLSAEGKDQFASGSATDNAGNTAQASVPGINIDKTAPEIAGTRSPAPNANGWNNTDVTVSFACSDALSGIAGCGPTPQVVSSQGSAQARSAKASDRAGNEASTTVGTINIDKTAPTVTCSASPNELWPPNHRLVDVTAAVTVADALSGSAGFVLTSAVSNEPDEGLGDGDTVNDIQDFTVGLADTQGRLRAERDGRNDGRVYTLTYNGADVAGNLASCAARIVVPKSRR